MQNEWWCNNRLLADVAKIIETSDIALGVLNEDGKLIGFARVLTDYVYKALIFDVIVEPSYRQSGLGREVVEHLLNLETLRQVKSFELYCPERISGFYEKLGFVKSSSNLLTLDR
jgi:predicted GNAT family N-acyltransferase